MVHTKTRPPARSQSGQQARERVHQNSGGAAMQRRRGVGGGGGCLCRRSVPMRQLRLCRSTRRRAGGDSFQG